MELNNFSEKTFRMLIKMLDNNLSNYSESDNIYDNEEILDIIDDVIKYFGITKLEISEYGFFWMLWVLNKDTEDSKIVIPKKSSYEVLVEVDETQHVERLYKHRVESYMTKPIQIEYQLTQFDFDPWGGTLVDENYYDGSTNSEKVINIKKINE